MKKVLIVMIGLLLIGANVYAQGDLEVNGKLGLGAAPAGFAKFNLSSNAETFGLALTHTRDTTGPVAGASYFVFLDGSSGTYGGETGGFSNTVVYRRQTNTDTNSSLYGGFNQALIGTSGGTGHTIDNLSGMRVKTGMHNGFNSTVTLNNAYGIFSGGLVKNGSGGNLTVDDFRHIYLQDRDDQLGGATLAVTSQTGLWIDKQALGSNNYGIVLNGDESGADIVFGTGNNVKLYARSGELYVLDSALNETPLGPHDFETGEWIFYSKNLKTGRTVRVNMEKLVKAVEKLTGETFMVETLMEDQ